MNSSAALILAAAAIIASAKEEICTPKKVPNGRMAVKNNWAFFSCNKDFILIPSQAKKIKCSKLRRYSASPRCISIVVPQSDQPTYDDYEDDGKKKNAKDEYGDYYDYDYNELQAKSGRQGESEIEEDYNDIDYNDEYYDQLAKAISEKIDDGHLEEDDDEKSEDYDYDAEPSSTSSSTTGHYSNANEDNNKEDRETSEAEGEQEQYDEYDNDPGNPTEARSSTTSTTVEPIIEDNEQDPEREEENLSSTTHSTTAEAIIDQYEDYDGETSSKGASSGEDHEIPIKSDNDNKKNVAYDDDEDYDEEESSGGYERNYPKHSSTSKPRLEDDEDSEYEIEGSGYSKAIMYPTPTSTSSTSSTTTEIITDDEDLVQGSGEEGSGDSGELNPEEVYNYRREFYYKHEVDLMRLDTSCKAKFISAPQIFNAKVSEYNHEVKNVVIPGKFYSTVLYICDDGFKSESLQLFCSEEEWQGKYPECVSSGTSIIGALQEEELESETKHSRPSVCSEAEAAKCHHACTIENDEAVCKCQSGFILDLEDGVSCNDEDECNDSHNGGCDHICVNQPGAVSCQCRVGYALAGDGKTCIDNNECSLEPDLCGHGDCVNLPGTYLCECHPGFHEEKGVCQDIDECLKAETCPGNSLCSNLPGTYECLCQDGFQLDDVAKTCVDIDECLYADHGCDHICVNTVGSVICECQQGYELMENGQSCQDMDECAEGKNVCLHGDCINIPGSHECYCHPGFELNHHNQSCDDVDECSQNSLICGEHGQCLNLIGTFECKCETGYEIHHNATSCSDINECLFNNGGCDQICTNKPGSFLCQCSEGFTLNLDGKRCTDIDECQDPICGHHGECVNLPGSFSCQCHDGFHTENGICADINECILYEHDLCGNHSQCINLLGSFECQCDSGYHMDETIKACVMVDECKLFPNMCGHGECVSKMPGYECVCFQGSELVDGTCRDIDECKLSTPCGPKGECLNTQGSYRCECSKGFRFERGTCEDIDECAAEDQGGCSHFCINMEGGHRCECPNEFELESDGRTCKLAERNEPCISRERPKDGYLRCNSKKIRGQGKFPVGTKCRLKCRKGYKYNPAFGPLKTVCTKDGNWSELGSCEPKLCPQLTFLQNGLVDPPECSMVPQKGGTKCSFHCNPGYKLSGKKTIACSKKTLEWKNEMPTCETDFPKPFIICPADITKPLSGRGSSVYVMIPQPKTNVDWFRYVDAEPSWAKQLEGEMTRGRHVITFRARSPMASVSSSCQMIIHVKDMEPPRAQQCPRSFTEMLSPGQSVKKITWTEPVFSDNVKIQHVMASFLPGHYFSAGKHNVLYQATDADGNMGKCGFTITVLHNGSGQAGRHPDHNRDNSDIVLPPPTTTRSDFRNFAEKESNSSISICDSVPSIDSGRMVCMPYGSNGKRCTPVCNAGHQFYQKFDGQPPTYLCLPPKRVDWNIRKFIPDCSPTHDLPINGRECEAGWEQRGSNTCVACPPGMYRPQKEPLCQLCPKGLYSDQFGSATCVRCPMHHTTRGLGSRKASHCYYHRPAARSSLLDRRKSRHKDNEASFMYYNRWMSRGSSKDEDDIT